MSTTNAALELELPARQLAAVSSASSLESGNGLLSYAKSELSIQSEESITHSLISNESIQQQRHDNGSTPSFDILPSYQMHQSILNRPLSSSHDQESTFSALPAYSMTSNATTSLESTTIDHQENSILCNINKIPVLNTLKDIKVSIEVTNPQNCYTNGDIISGVVTLENISKNEIPFQMFFVSFEGITKSSAGAVVEEKIFKEAFFLGIVDLGASWTDADTADHYDAKTNTYSGLPKTRILAPKTRYTKMFSFTVPNASLENCCSHQLSEHSNLPPSFGAADLSLSTYCLRDKMHEKFSYNDLTVPGYTINYSVNARLITLAADGSPSFVVRNPERYSVKFVPKSMKNNNEDYDSFKVSPSYQLNQTLRQIENDIREIENRIDVVSQDRRILLYDRRDSGGGQDLGVDTRKPYDTKQPNLYKESPLDISHSSIMSQPTTKRWRKDYQYFRKKKPSSKWSLSKSLTGKSCSSPGDGHEPQKSNFPEDGKLSIFTSETLVLDMDSFTGNDKKASIPFTINFEHLMPHCSYSQSEDIAKLFLLEPDTELHYINVTSKGLPIPIELDPDWFTSRKQFQQSIRSKLSAISKRLQKLPKGTALPTSSLHSFNALSRLNYETGKLSKAINVVNSSSGTSELVGNNTYESAMHLQLQINTSRLKSTVILPDFQSCSLGRMYFLRFKFRTKSSDFDVKYDTITEDVIKQLDGNYKFYLDVPISIKKKD